MLPQTPPWVFIEVAMVTVKAGAHDFESCGDTSASDAFFHFFAHIFPRTGHPFVARRQESISALSSGL